MSKKKIPNNIKALAVRTDSATLDTITNEFLEKAEIDSKKYARWELNFLWTKFRQLKVSDIFKLDIESLTVSEALVVNALKNAVRLGDLTEINKLYDRLLGKPKEYREDKVIDDVSFTIDILNPPNEEK